MSSSDAISIISITDEHNNGEIRNKTKPENGITFESKHGLIMDCFYVIAIIAFCLLFTIPWTTIPRTNSIIYQSPITSPRHDDLVNVYHICILPLVFIATKSFYQEWIQKKSRNLHSLFFLDDCNGNSK